MSRANERMHPVPPGCEIRGLTIREHFAAMAMQAMIGTAAAPCLTGFDGAEFAIAEAAARMADALIAELSKVKP